MAQRPKLGPVRSLLVLSPVLLITALVAVRQHHSLPTPLTDLTSPTTGLPQISESRILGYAKELSEDIGYRTVGTEEHARADRWMMDRAQEVRRECEEVVRRSNGAERKLECEVWHQVGSGSHRFDMMGKRLYKTYVNLTNIVVRISDGTEEGKQHAVLVNAHLDSTLPSPGAADDAIAVGVMLDCMRVLVNTPSWEPKHAIIFLFNNAEESLQDGSHLFSTQHPIASTVRAVMNLEAAGTTGREILFQATSHEMIVAYSHVPRPFGTIFANDVFSSGILLSDTDFRQFEQYLNVTGLDMAVVGNSYLYHMRKDLVENIQPGVAQNMAENTLALLQYLSAPGSPIPTLTTYTRPSTVFYSYLGCFFIYSFTTAKILYSLLLVASLIFAFYTASPRGIVKDLKDGVKVILSSLAGAVLGANAVAVVMVHGLDKGMSWFRDEYSPLPLYGSGAMFGAMLSQLLIGPVSEHSIFAGLLVVQSSLALGIQMLGVGSAAIFFISGFPLLVVSLLNSLWTRTGARVSTSGGGERTVSLITYALGQVFPALGGVLLLSPVLEVFVPLTGRIGGSAPADNIIATIVSSIGCLALPLAAPFLHRFGMGKLRRGTVVMACVTAGMVAVYSGREPFDGMHQKRLFVLHLENVTTGEQHLHLASADGAPGFEGLVRDIVDVFAPVHVRGVREAAVTPVKMDEYNSDWDPVYPFSAFLTPYKIPLAVDPAYVSPWSTNVSTSGGNGGEKAFEIRAVDDHWDWERRERSLKLEIRHPGLIWTVIAFDAHVLKWNLDDNPPDEYVRHHVKEASFYGIDVWSIDLVLKLPSTPLNSAAGGNKAPEDGKLLVNFIGLQESGMWPGKRAVKEQGGMAMELFEELDGWVEKHTRGTVDAMLLGCVAGVTAV